MSTFYPQIFGAVIPFFAKRGKSERLTQHATKKRSHQKFHGHHSAQYTLFCCNMYIFQGSLRRSKQCNKLKYHACAIRYCCLSCCMGKPQNTFATITCPFTLYTHEWSYVEKKSICFLLIYLSPFFFLFFLHFLFIYQSILLIKYKHNNTQTYIHLIYINRPQRELKIQLYFHLRNNATSVLVKTVRYLQHKVT